MNYRNSLHRISLDECESTNNFLRENLSELKDRFPVLVTARNQTKGRGRDNRCWYSLPDRGIYCTFGIRWPNRIPLTWFSLAAGISVCEMLRDVTSREFSIKWPNDIQWEDKKIGGVLIENVILTEEILSLCGIGLNISQQEADFPSDLRWRAISLAMVTGETYQPRTLYPCLEASFFRWIEIVQKGNYQRLLDSFHDLSFPWMGKTILFHKGEKKIEGTYLGISQEGGLRLRTALGDEQLFFCGEIDSLT